MITKKVLIALIGAAAIIIAAIIGAVVNRETNRGSTSSSRAESNAENSTIVNVNPQTPLEDVTVLVLDGETGVPVPGAVITVTGSDGKVVLQNRIAETGQYQVRALEKDDYTVRASADNYEAAEQMFNLHAVPWEIRLNKLVPPSSLAPLSFAGWTSWGRLSANPRSNTVTLNGAVISAGYMVTGIESLRGRRLVLEFAGTENSSFYNNQLLKLETEDGAALKPEEILTVIEDGYIPASDGRVTFAIPDSFGGRLNMVFYKADLRNLRITAFCE
jgi:hypothetical protein